MIMMGNHHTLERVLPILRCKKDCCGFSQHGEAIFCDECGQKVDLIDGRIPNFLTRREIREYEGPSYLSKRAKSAFWRWVYKHIPRPQSVLVRKKEQRLVYDFIDSVDEDELILNVGSGNLDYGEKVINVDIFPGDNVDVLADSTDLPFEGEFFGAVMSLAVLEHVPDIEAALREMDWVLKKSGSVFHAIPFIQPAHGVPKDYRRYTLKGIEELFSGYKKYKSGLVNGPGSAISWCLREYFAIVTSFGTKFLYNAGMYFWGWIFLPLKFTDYLLTGSRFAHQLGSGFYYWGRKLSCETEETG